MTPAEFHSFLMLLMSSDPSPISADHDKALRNFADRHARSLGYVDWLDAYHRLGC